MEWPADHHIFIYQVEADLLWKREHPSDFFHPLIIIYFLGQLLLLVTIFQKTPGKKLTYAAIACLSCIMLLLLFIGLLGLKLKMILCSLPFVLTAVITIVNYKRQKT